jgi:hypothetical protein
MLSCLVAGYRDSVTQGQGVSEVDQLQFVWLLRLVGGIAIALIQVVYRSR